MGLVLGNYLRLPQKASIILMATLLAASLFSILFKWRKSATILLLIVFVLIGGLHINLYTYPDIPRLHISNLLRDDGLNVQGTLYKPPKYYEDRLKLYVRAERVYVDEGYIKTTGRVLITIGDTDADLKYGDRVRFVCKLRRPRNFNNPGGFDYSRYLLLQGIFVTGYIKTGTDVIRIGKGDTHAFWKMIENSRDKIRRFIDERPELLYTGIVKAVLLGEKGEISEERKDSFAAVGVAHVLAISGLHMGFIALVVFVFMRWILRFSERVMLFSDINRIAAVFTLFPVFFYSFIAGFGVSTFRAMVMIVTYLMAVIIGRQRDLYNTLALAAFIITVFSPTSIFDISFQLSFVSVFAILYLTPRFLEYFSSIPGPSSWPVNSVVKRVGRYSGLLVLVSFAATLGTGPILAYHFNRIVTLGFISNVFIVPAVGFLIIPISLLLAVMVFISQPIASVLLVIDSYMIGYVVETVDLFARIPSLSYWVTTPTLLEIFLFYLFIAFLFNIGKFKRAGYITLILLFLITVDYCYWYCKKNLNQNLRVTFLSVGQGDSAVIEFPKGVRMIIDGGGFYNDSFDTGKNILAPFLWKTKIKRVDYLLLSHPHPDHLNGLRFIAKNFDVKEIWTNGQGIDMESYYELMEIIRGRGIRKIVMNSLTPSKDVHEVKVDILNPPALLFHVQEKGFHKAINNNSLVVKLTLKKISFLFTGDIGEEAEKALILHGSRLKSTVMKVPHHGSLTSSTKRFLSMVGPSYAVFSVGYKNRFGFPREEIVNRYKDRGSKTYRTDMDGAITMETDGQFLKTKTVFGPWNLHRNKVAE